MNAEEYLQQAKNAELMIQNKLAQVKKLRAVREEMRNEDITISDEAAQELDKLEAELSSDIKQFVFKAREIMAVLDQIEPQLRELLYKRYLEGKTWARIAEETEYTERQLSSVEKIKYKGRHGQIQYHRSPRAQALDRVKELVPGLE